MAEIVITEFMDDDVARELAEAHDVLYDPGLADRAPQHGRTVAARRARGERRADDRRLRPRRARYGTHDDDGKT